MGVSISHFSFFKISLENFSEEIRFPRGHFIFVFIFIFSFLHFLNFESPSYKGLESLYLYLFLKKKYIYKYKHQTKTTKLLC
ncbi:hypothetical protein VPHK404_0089 [Vibrio phage K404]